MPSKVFPLLFECDRNDRKILKGILNIVDSNGKHWESYEVEIHCPENYPEQFPILFETSDKIPKIGDWHIYEDTLAYCVKVQPEEILRCKEGITLTKYIQEEGLALFV